MRKKWLIGAAATAVAGVALTLLVVARVQGSADKGKRPKADAVLEFRSSEVTQPVLTALPERIEFSGPLMAPNTAVIRAKAAGTLLSLAVAEGSRVTAGQVLGRIDLADLQSRSNERSAMVDAARARVVEAERGHMANEGLAQQQFISATALESSRATLESARAQLRSAQAQLATSALIIRDAALVAPIPGVVGRRSVVPGERVSPEQELLTVVDLKLLELTGVVGTHQIAALKVGQRLAVSVEGSGRPVDGRIDRIAPTTEAGTRGIRVVAVLANPQEVFRAGQYASAAVVLDDAKQRLTLPQTALGQASGQDFVWAIEAGHLVRRIVITGRRDNARGLVEILQGLRPDAQVLGARFDSLKEGAVARIAAGAATSASAASAS